MEIYRYEWHFDDGFKISVRKGYVSGKDAKMAEQKVENKHGEGNVELTRLMGEKDFNDLVYNGSCTTYSEDY